MPPARYMKLTSVQESTLRQLYRRTDNADVHSRCQMILLSAQGHSAAEIAGLTFFDQGMVLVRPLRDRRGEWTAGSPSFWPAAEDDWLEP